MTTLLICASDSGEASRWARSQGLEPGSYVTTTGYRGERGLRGYGGVVFVVLPGYWDSVPRGHVAEVAALLERLIVREPDPVTRMLDDGVVRAFVVGARAAVEPLMRDFTAGGRRAPARN
ncbi:hypothetical protein [Embleya sp. NPDC059237]|uniref:hypothetical protein n=1 Tax=Embleya sp. NPDC059237 TaxID=3346784 RepID=UPI003696D4EE